MYYNTCQSGPGPFARLGKRIPPFSKHEILIPFSKDLTTVPYSESDESYQNPKSILNSFCDTIQLVIVLTMFFFNASVYLCQKDNISHLSMKTIPDLAASHNSYLPGLIYSSRHPHISKHFVIFLYMSYKGHVGFGSFL
jgi:hypothetical protein